MPGAFHYSVLPAHFSYGAEGGVDFRTTIVSLDNLAEERTLSRPRGRRTFDVSSAIQSFEDLTELLTFFRARKGAFASFPMQDYTDYSTSPTMAGGPGAVAGTKDQEIGIGDNSTTTFQLIKTYTNGLTDDVYTITLPQPGTTRVWLDNTEQLSGWSVDEQTGIITFTSAPSTGVHVYASCLYYVKVRFDAQAGENLRISIENYSSGTIRAINLIEDIDPNAAYVDQYFYGGAYEVSSAVNLNLSTAYGRLWAINMTATGKSASLPNYASIPTGGIHFIVHNAGANSFTIKDHLGTTLVTLTSGQATRICLSVQSGGTKVWYAI